MPLKQQQYQSHHDVDGWQREGRRLLPSGSRFGGRATVRWRTGAEPGWAPSQSIAGLRQQPQPAAGNQPRAVPQGKVQLLAFLRQKEETELLYLEIPLELVSLCQGWLSPGPQGTSAAGRASALSTSPECFSSRKNAELPWQTDTSQPQTRHCVKTPTYLFKPLFVRLLCTTKDILKGLRGDTGYFLPDFPLFQYY